MVSGQGVSRLLNKDQCSDACDNMMGHTHPNGEARQGSNTLPAQLLQGRDSET